MEFRDGGRAGSRRRWIVGGSVGEHDRVLGLVRPIGAGRVQCQAVKQQHVAGFERDQLAAVKEFPVVGEFLVQELPLVELPGIKRHGVAAGDEFESAVFGGFRSQRQPGTDEFRSFE